MATPDTRNPAMELPEPPEADVPSRPARRR